MAMPPLEDLPSLLQAKLDARLKHHIRHVDLSPISRVDSKRLQKTAFPLIGLIELVSGPDFSRLYQNLYTAAFHGGERERPELIVDRLNEDFAGKRSGLAPYRIIGIRDQIGRAAAAAQFSILMTPDEGNGEGSQVTVPYLQYIYVRPDCRRQDLSEVLHTLVLGVAIAEGTSAEAMQPACRVPFTLYETEPPGHGEAISQQNLATERTAIHTRSGGAALMLRDRATGRLLSAHVQPGLEDGERPLTLIWALRANPRLGFKPSEVEGISTRLIAAYYQSLRDERFPEANIALAERIARRRLHRCNFTLVPLTAITRDMYVDVD